MSSLLPCSLLPLCFLRLRTLLCFPHLRMLLFALCLRTPLCFSASEDASVFSASENASVCSVSVDTSVCTVSVDAFLCFSRLSTPSCVFHVRQHLPVLSALDNASICFAKGPSCILCVPKELSFSLHLKGSLSFRCSRKGLSYVFCAQRDHTVFSPLLTAPLLCFHCNAPVLGTG